MGAIEVKDWEIKLCLVFYRISARRNAGVHVMLVGAKLGFGGVSDRDRGFSRVEIVRNEGI